MREVGDIVDMYLDLDNNKLCFTSNGKNYVHIFDGTKYDKSEIEAAEYKLAMTLSREVTVVELVSYEEICEIPDAD